MFGSNQVSYQPEGNMPSDVCSTISQDLPFNTPRNQVLLANKWKKSYDNPRVFVKSILKPFKGFEAVFEYTFDKNMYDYNFYTGKTQYTDIQVDGTLKDAAKKVFRGSIDFKRGSSGSKGAETENVLLLGDDVENKTIPLILCAEEDVDGSHGATIGELDEETLFYFAARGIDQETAEDIMTKAKLEVLYQHIQDEETERIVADQLTKVMSNDSQ